MAVPEPTEVAPWYLRNITQALELNSATGQVFVRTNAAIVGNVTVGNVAIGSLGNVDITGNSLPVTVESGNVTVFQGDDPWNIAGNVAILGNVNVTQGTSPWVVSGNVGITGNANVVLADDANVVISGFSGATADAFGRLRVSNPFTLFDTQSRYYDHGQFASNVTGTGNVVYVENQSSFQLNVGTASGDSVLRETLKPFPYQPGKSQLSLNTFCMNTPKTNLRQRVGLFDANDGVFFENDGTYNYFVIRSGSTGVEERVRQDAWNGDRLDGLGGATNPSGITLYPQRTQIMYADVEWLGVGSVRVGFVIDGAYIICHTFNHANQSGNTKVYMTTASLPIRFEITNAGNVASPSMMTQICSSVISEGGFQLSGSGNPRAASHLISTPVRLPNDQSFKPVIGIRLKSNRLNAVVIPINYSLIPTAGSIFAFRVYKRAITSGGSWVDSAADSSVQYNLAPTALVSGDIAEQSFINSTNQSTGAPTQEPFSFEYQLERDPFTGVAYEYVITMATTGTNQDVYASVEWQEIT
jgi:ATP-dependent protease HslVU (ClpYQ) peptidase subunit